MAKKPFTHRHRSTTHKCIVCGKGIKMNVLSRKSKVPRVCFKHRFLLTRKEAK